MKDKSYISKRKFMEELRRYEKGSVTRRHFLGVTGLGTATAVMAGAFPGLGPSRALAGSHIGDRVVLATWPNYHDPENFEIFTDQTGAFTQVNVFGSNEEMLAKLQAGGSGWDVYVPTNYTITTYVEEGLIEPLDLSKLPNYDRNAFDPRFADAG
ncbi:MAG: extracellular solute-binding protein, partial [Rhodobacteraceae bacterium]|nr:extracellular solute-binding protein [Paracoccaceae bacterium]